MSLKVLEVNCSIYSKQIKELKVMLPYEYTLLIWQSALNFMGLSENTTLLQGKALLDPEEFLIRRHDPILVATMQAQQSRMHVIFGEHGKGADLSIANGYDLSKVSPGSANLPPALFCGGISSFEIARKTRKQKFKKHAKKIHATIKSWVKNGNPNVIHYDRLLDAERAALDGKSNAALKHYQSAVSLAARGGFVHDAALANERYAEYLLHDMSDRQEAIFYFEEAIRFYSEWGALKKVDLLRDKYSDLWEDLFLVKRPCVTG
jgi:tetratricopeptide (TPR) repeat protein